MQVLGGVLKSDAKSGGAGNNMLLGCLCLLANTVSMAAYYILAKHLVQKYNPVCIAAWAYIVAASMMGTTALLTVQRNEWTVPSAMFGPLIYWCGSVLRLRSEFTIASVRAMLQHAIAPSRRALGGAVCPNAFC